MMLEEQVASLAIFDPIVSDDDARVLESIIIPRGGPFSAEEVIYLSERFPSPELHPALLAYRGSRGGTVFYRGWILNEDAFWQKALAKGLGVFYTNQQPDYFSSICDYAYAVLKEISVTLPVNCCVNMAIGSQGPRGLVRFHLSIQDNYHATGELSAEKIEKVRQVFGFAGGPQWYISAMEMCWRFKSN